MAPENVPGWARDQAKLWNAVEAAERRKDAQLVREVNVALPRELDLEEQVGLLREYVRDAYVSHGMVAGIAVHVHDVKNPHAHIMLTTRDIGPEGFGKKNRSWNDREMLETQREQWAETCNRWLSLAGHKIRVDHRSLSAQGIERLPTVHLGPNVIRMERRGLSTDRGDIARKVEKQNEELRGISAKIIDFTEARKRMEETRAREKEAERVRMIEQRHQVWIEREQERALLRERERMERGDRPETLPEMVKRVKEEAIAGYRWDLIRRGEWEPFGCLGERDAAEAAEKEARDQWREEEIKWTLAERERARQGIRGDFVQDRSAGKEREVPVEGPGAPSMGTPARELAAGRFYIKVPFEEKDAAKAKGAKWDAEKRSWYIPAGVDRTPFEKWLDKGAGEPQKTPAGRETAIEIADVGRTNDEQEHPRQTEDLAQQVQKGKTEARARFEAWKLACAGKQAAREAFERAKAEREVQQGAEPERRGIVSASELAAALDKEANSRAWQGKRPIVEAAVKEYPELAGTAVALEAIAQQPGFSSGSFEDRNRLMRVIEKVGDLIKQGEPLRGEKDPRLEKIKQDVAKQYERENQRGMSR